MNERHLLRLTQQDFEAAFGEPLDALTKEEIGAHDFTLERIVEASRDSLIIEILEKIRHDSQIVGDPSREAVWEIGWRENYESFMENAQEEELVPKFIRPDQPVRWQGEFFRPMNPNFEESFTCVLRSFVFGRITREFGDQEAVHLYEFGAGTGWNLLHAHRYFQSIGRAHKLFGSDFVDSAVELMNHLARKRDVNLSAWRFDMRRPDFSRKFENPGLSGVVTFGALEQLAGDVEPMIDFLLDQRPRIVIHVEPAIENYDVSGLEDYLASWFQGNRGYSSGLEALLKMKEAEGNLDLLRTKRIGFGSKMMEGYNLFIWRPRESRA